MGLFSQYTRATVAAPDDLILMDDVHDTTMASTGTTKSIPLSTAVAAATVVLAAQRTIYV